MANKKTTVRRKPLSEINVVPYLDVMLVLLVVFMVTAPMMMQGVKVELPEVTAEPIDIPQDQDMITVSVKQDGSFYLNVGDRPTESKALDDIVGLVLDWPFRWVFYAPWFLAKVLILPCASSTM